MPAEVALLGYAMPFARDTRYDSLLRLCPIIKMLRIFSLSLSLFLYLYIDIDIDIPSIESISSVYTRSFRSKN